MKSFRSEIENPIVEKDILDLERRIKLFYDGKIDEEKFRSLRLARGVYGQRQFGVQMVRIKLPYGKVSSEQLRRIADVSDEYASGNLHITTRQDIQIHYVSLDRTPELWAELEKSDITLREACGNTLRNVTASEMAGVDPDELFDVSPYADAVFQYFLRNPICQEMGRKFKIAFSSSDKDTALTFMHDLGFIPRVKNINGKEKRGFKVILAGGLGSQPRQGDVAYEFLEEEKLIPYIEGVLRVFDRHGERAKRLKARVKFLVKDMGVEVFQKLVAEEQKALVHQTVSIDTSAFEEVPKLSTAVVPDINILDNKAYELWKRANVIPQKQKGLFAVGLKVKTGDIKTPEARKLATIFETYAADEIRLTLRQNVLIRYVQEQHLPVLYQELNKIGLAEPGFNTVIDITACPGTDTCNLGIASSMGIAPVLEDVLKKEYPKYIDNKELTIKISGCMNACGQHNMAHIGFQGMSVKAGNAVAPAVQVLLGGGIMGGGQGRFSDKVIKIPSKRAPQALRMILNDFEANKLEKEAFLDYYDRQGKIYFYELLKDLANVDNLVSEDFIDWGSDEKYVKEIGTGECAGVVIDLVGTLLLESEEKSASAKESFAQKKWADAIYHAYSSMINTAKALLVAEEKKTNSYAGIVDQFDAFFIETGKIKLESTFHDLVYQIKQHEPSEAFAQHYLENANDFYSQSKALR